MSDQQDWTVLRLLQWTTDYLRSNGSESPRLDAEILLAIAMDCERIELYTAFDQIADDSTRAAFRKLVQQRATGKPVAYIVGQREFYSRMFSVTPDVLIPRPETEFLIIELLDRIPTERRKAHLELLDIGTGSGIVAVCAALALENAKVTAVDISPAALHVAQTNATKHGVEDRVAFCESDLTDALPANRQFDFILSNAPYISEEEFPNLDKTVHQFEPRVALVAGPTGTEIIDRIVAQAVGRLREGGWLLLEVSPTTSEAVQQTIAAQGAYERVTVRADLGQLPRVIAARRTS